MTTQTPLPIDPKLEPSWKAALADEFGQDYFQRLKRFLLEERARGQVIYPPGPQIFEAFARTPFERVRIVILGQDPYHGAGQAHGLSFSVPDGVKPPPSLVNVFKELHDDLGVRLPRTGNLLPWARQGVLLLNATLTVAAGQPGSHHGQGWEAFTDAAIRALNDRREGVIFVLWGRNARDKGRLIDTTRHHVLRSAHPSPYSANSGFFGSRPFSRINAILRDRGEPEIDWSPG